MSIDWNVSLLLGLSSIGVAEGDEVLNVIVTAGVVGLSKGLESVTVPFATVTTVVPVSTLTLGR